jgi:nicotinamidase-related amidase
MRQRTFRSITAALLGAALCVPSLALADILPPADVPSVPDPTPVMLDPSTTVLAVLDINSAICPPRPACIASVPVVQRLLLRAHAASMPVVYSTTPGATTLPAVAPRTGEPIVTGRADKFFNTELDQLLQDRGAQTVVIVGAAANGAVLYTSFGAVLRGYTVVVAIDGISSGPDFDTFLAEYQVLNQPGFSNPTNDPLKPNLVTLSRSDLISFSTASK